MTAEAPDAEKLEFQQYARRWLAENRPPSPSFRLPINAIEIMTVEQRDYLRDWQSKCYAAGLVGADIAKAYGGGGHTGFQRIANAEMNRAGTPFLFNIVALNMAVPTILVHGTEEQKRRFVPGALSGEEIWCQGFSEPGAGSDMANQQTFAERVGDDWRVNGHKVWTSLGHFADFMILIARTSRDHKYDGLTYFLCPIAGQPGVTVRPLVKMTGESGFNEVLFENVELPDSLRLDAVGKGWTVAMTTLTHERGAAESAGGGGGGLHDSIDQPGRAGEAVRERRPVRRRRSGDPRRHRPAGDRGRGAFAERPARSRPRAERSPDAAPAPAEGGRHRVLPGHRAPRRRHRRRPLDALQARRVGPGRRTLAARLHDVVRQHDRRRNQRSAAQHPGRAGARAAEVEVKLDGLGSHERRRTTHDGDDTHSE